MAIPIGFKNIKEVGIYCFSDDNEGNIDVSFNIKEPGDYTLKITEKELRSMQRFSDIGKMLSVEKKSSIDDANEACDSMENCNQCAVTYGGHDHNDLIPCNFIRKKYRVSIWDYKEDYRRNEVHQ